MYVDRTEGFKRNDTAAICFLNHIGANSEVRDYIFVTASCVSVTFMHLEAGYLRSVIGTYCAGSRQIRTRLGKMSSE